MQWKRIDREGARGVTQCRGSGPSINTARDEILHLIEVGHNLRRVEVADDVLELRTSCVEPHCAEGSPRGVHTEAARHGVGRVANFSSRSHPSGTMQVALHRAQVAA